MSAFSDGDDAGILGPQRELVHQPSGDPRRQECVSGDDRPDRVEQLDRFGVLDQEAARTDADRFEHVLVEVERRQHDHPHIGEPLVVDDPTGRREAVRARHADVHQHDVGPVLDRQPNGFVAI